MLRLRARFADWLQFSEKIVGEKTRVGIVRVIGSAVSFNLLGRFCLWRLNGLGFSLRRLIRCNRLYHFLFGSPFQFRVFQLLTDSHTFAGPHKFWQIGVKSMMRKPSQFNAVVKAVHPARQSNTKYFRRFDCILAENLVKIADTEHKNGVGMLLLHFLILFEQRLILLLNLLGEWLLFRSFRLYFGGRLYLRLWCRGRFDRVRRRRLDTVGIIQLQIQTQV